MVSGGIVGKYLGVPATESIWKAPVSAGGIAGAGRPSLYTARAATEFTLAAQADDPAERKVHAEMAEAYEQLAEAVRMPGRARRRART
ncbi:MAG: hypothetical protein WDN24_10755 [Sphingomonas sp.]